MTPKSPWPCPSRASACFICSTPSAPAAALLLCALEIFFFGLGRKLVAERPRLRAPLDPIVPAQERRPGSLHWPVQSMGRIAADGRRPRTDLAGYACQPAADSKTALSPVFASPIRASTDQATPTDGFMPGMDVRARLTVVGDGPVGQSRQALDAALRPACRATHTREWALGMKFVIELPEDTELTARHRLAHLRFSRAGDLRLPLRPSRPARLRRHLRPLLARRPLAHRLPLSAALHPAPRSLAAPQRRNPALLGRQSPSRSPASTASRSSPATATPASASPPARPTCSPAPASTRPGPPACNSASRSSNCSAPASPSPSENLAATYEARRRASWVERGAREAENARNGFHHGFVRGLIGMALAGLTKGKLSLPRSSPPAHRQIQAARRPSPPLTTRRPRDSQ